MSKQIEFKGIGDEGTCDKCGRNLKNTYHFLVEGEHIILGSECATRVHYSLTKKKLTSFKRVENRIQELKESYKKYETMEVLSFLPKDEKKQEELRIATELKEIPLRIKILENSLIV